MVLLPGSLTKVLSELEHARPAMMGRTLHLAPRTAKHTRLAATRSRVLLPGSLSPATVRLKLAHARPALQGSLHLAPRTAKHTRLAASRSMVLLPGSLTKVLSELAHARPAMMGRT